MFGLSSKISCQDLVSMLGFSIDISCGVSVLGFSFEVSCNCLVSVFGDFIWSSLSYGVCVWLFISNKFRGVYAGVSV